MKKAKILLLIGVMMMSLTFSVGCTSRSGNVNNISGETIDKLPEEQKDTELDKALASIRKARKESVTVQNGSSSIISGNGSNLPGQSKNMPDFSKEGTEKWQQLGEVTTNYIANELKVPKRPVYEYDSSQCLDPRINAIYDETDKGVANGYDNENIFIEEYETEVDDVYSYIFLVRESKDSPWKVIHHGNSYKE
ncbi:MAG: hypothetical protein RR620_04190 [Clostridium sp.]